MHAIKQICDTLRAMGARPETTTDANGDAVIKVNAPTIEKENSKGDTKK